jgi:hypothetical protein
MTRGCQTLSVMAGLVPAIHAFNLGQDVDARHKAGHDKQRGILPVLRTGLSEPEGRDAVPQKETRMRPQRKFP